jgi:hypothetical protein
MVNPVAGGFVTGAILARNAGPRAAFGGGMAFCAFSTAIELFMRRETPEYVYSPLYPRFIADKPPSTVTIRRPSVSLAY